MMHFLGRACLSTIEWHEGCLCELKPAATESDLGTHAIFGTQHFRSHGHVARFCPCSIETVQTLNAGLIVPRLLPLLNTTFFRYFRVELLSDCAFWEDRSTCRLPACGVEECDEAEVTRIAACDAAEEERSLGAFEYTTSPGDDACGHTLAE